MRQCDAGRYHKAEGGKSYPHFSGQLTSQATDASQPIRKAPAERGLCCARQDSNL